MLAPDGSFWLCSVLKTDAAVLKISRENNCSRKGIRYNYTNSHDIGYQGACWYWQLGTPAPLPPLGWCSSLWQRISGSLLCLLFRKWPLNSLFFPTSSASSLKLTALRVIDSCISKGIFLWSWDSYIWNQFSKLIFSLEYIIAVQKWSEFVIRVSCPIWLSAIKLSRNLYKGLRYTVANKKPTKAMSTN